jgi:hypothetical protein
MSDACPAAQGSAVVSSARAMKHFGSNGDSSRPGSTGSQSGSRYVKDMSAHVFLCGVLEGSISFEHFRKAALHTALSNVASCVNQSRSERHGRSPSPPKNGAKGSWALHWMPQKQAVGTKLVSGKMPECCDPPSVCSALERGTRCYNYDRPQR